MWKLEECRHCMRGGDYRWKLCSHNWEETHKLIAPSSLLSCLRELSSMANAYQFVRFRISKGNAAILSDIVEISPEKSYFF